MKALIDHRNGRVCQIEQDEDVFPVDPRGFHWVECDDTITTDHEFVIKKLEKETDDVKRKKIKKITGDFVIDRAEKEI